MTIISPSLLACDFLNIENELQALAHNENIWIHLDIMDGHFVPNLTFGHPIIDLIAAKTKLPLDIHFMVSNPEFYIETLKHIAFEVFTFHIEASSKPIPLIHDIKKFSRKAGISLRPGTALELLTDDILKSVDLVLVMSVEPGFGGQGFMPESLERIKLLKQRRNELGANFLIEVDGGVNPSNAASIIQAGADVLVAGSAVFKNIPSNYTANINALRGN